MELISVIIPIYKVEKYLRQCIDSVISQSYTDLQIILVDDGSPDKCGIICDEYCNLDKRVSVIHKSNGGLSSARNAGLKIAKGKYIVFIDSDDWIEKNMIEKLHYLAEKYQCDLVQCKFKEFSDSIQDKECKEKGQLVNDKDVKVINNIEALNNLYSERYIETVVAWNKLYRSTLFNDIRYPEGKIHEDEFVIHEILYKCEKVILYEEYLYNYRITENSIMNKSFNNKRLDKLEAMKNRLKFFYNLKLIDLYKKALLFYKYLLIDYYFLAKESFNSDEQVLWEIKYEYRKMFRNYIDNTKIKLGEKVMSYIFYLNPNFYYYIEEFRK